MIRTIAFTTALVAFAGPTVAQTESLTRCRTLADAASRLACYDAIPVASSGASQAVDGPRAALPAVPGAVSAPADFGMQKRERQAAPEGVESVIPGVFSGWEPKTRWRLANGQLWEVVDGSRGAYQLKDPKVRIRRGLVGNYVMEIDGVAQLLKVRRIE